MRRTILFTFAVIMAAMTGCKEKQEPQSLSKVNRSDFQMTVDGKKTDLYYLKNANGIEITVTDFGGRIIEWFAPDKNGNFADIVLGHDNIDAYVNYTGERFLGATIGRYGNRIANGKFVLDGQEYNLPQNNNGNTLHGGDKGFDMKVWDAHQESPSKIVFKYVSVDGEEGFPGNLRVEMIYELNDKNELVIIHKAETDKNTPVNLTHHSFFNLHGYGEGVINDHYMTLYADGFIPVNEGLIPLGYIEPVENTPMDFRTATLIGERADADFQQLEFGRGYDHCWVLTKTKAGSLEKAAEVYEPVSGRVLEVWTTEPGIQFYGGNFFDGSTKGKQGKALNLRASFALETQHYPDSPNQPNFPSTILEPGQKYEHTCIYKMGVK